MLTLNANTLYSKMLMVNSHTKTVKELHKVKSAMFSMEGTIDQEQLGYLKTRLVALGIKTEEDEDSYFAHMEHCIVKIYKQ